jgi:hypothetical protein
MAYLELFEGVAEHVRRQGVKVRFKRGKPLDPAAIERASPKAFIPIPTSLIDFYAEIGDGLEFGWSSKGKDAPFANHAICRLEECAPKSIDDVSWLTEWQDDYEFPHVEDPVLAKKTALKMRKWLAFWGIGNGDSLCLDTSADPSPVLFSKHDWYDGGSGENGHKIAESLFEFYSDWAQVCFQFPSSLWWPGVLNKNGAGINWASDEFREPFRLTAGQ